MKVPCNCRVRASPSEAQASVAWSVMIAHGLLPQSH